MDHEARQKRLDEKYPLDRSYGVSALLYHFHHIRELRFTRGDFDASLLLIDFYESFQEANLTDRQVEVLWLIFIEDRTQHQVARILDITQQAVSDHINSAISRIAATNRKKEAGVDGQQV
jgi:DNA-binding CsgD family transcriptional regulator